MAATTKLSSTEEESKYSQDMQLDEKLIPRKVPGLCSVRYGMAFLTQLCNIILMAQNVIMSITMVAMVNSTDQHSHVNISTEGLPVNSSGGPHKAANSLPEGVPVYNWSPEIQGIIFGAVTYGMILTLAPSGYLAGRIGTKKVFGAALFGSSLFILCTPPAADLGLGVLIVTRIAHGLSQGAGFGGQYALWEKWCPPHERSRICAIVLSGMALGPFVVIFLGGLISQVIGWPFVFYVFGGFGCVCCLLWIVLIYDDPVSHPWISTSEKEYITSSLAKQGIPFKQSLPIKEMVRSLPVWSMILCTVSYQWLLSVLVTYPPSYISYVFNINIRDNGIVSSIPFVFAWALGMLGGLLADFLLTKNFRVVTVRKIATVLGNFLPSVFLAAMPYLQSSYITTITFLTFSCGLASLCQSGVSINALDIAPRYSSFLIGTARAFAYLSALLVPTIGGFLLSQDPELGWRNIFFLLLAVNTLGLLVFVIFGEADVQEWAKESKVTRL